MTLIRKLAWALCLVGSLIASSTKAQDVSLVPGQVYSTGNIVANTSYGGPSSWTNGVYQNSLTCWGWGDPGYCGPNAIVRPGNNINFSYGTTDLYQVQAINSIISKSTGIQINGFNFGFTAKNGNGWDNGMQDYLSAYVRFYDSKNNLAANYDYTSVTNRKYNWTTFNFSETFTKPYAVNDLSTVRYGLVGRDNNYWAGPYGPEVYGVSFSLKYSVDPCVKDPLYSPTCKGFMDAMNKLTSSSTSPTSTTGTSSTVSILTSPAAMADPTKNDVTNTNVGGVQLTSTGEITAIVNVPKFVRGANEAGEVVKEKEKEKIRVLPVNIALPTPPAARRNDAAATLNLNSAGPDTSAVAPVEQQVSVAATTSILQDVVNQQSRAAAAPIITTRRNIANVYEASDESKDVATSFNNQTSLALGRGLGLQLNEIQPPQRQSMMSATNPLNSYLTMVPSENQPDQKATVKKDVQNNELAGGVDLSKMAIQPVGFADYMNLALTDAAFYGPKEVYQNQRVVDNARAQRLLQGASDRMHQEMINSQYK